MADSDKKIVEAGLKRFKLCEDAENDWRKAGLEADQFRVGNQWPKNVKQTRDVESRPCLTINRMPQFIRQVTNDARQNRPSVKIAPVDGSDDKKAEIYEGLIRHIQVASNADVAYDTACDSQVTKGWGYFRVITKYCDDDSFDQDILIKRIKNAFSVYFDPAVQEPDYSDARFAFVVEDMPCDEFDREFPDADNNSSQTFSSIGDTMPDWATKETIRVAEYFEVVNDPAKLYLLSNRQTLVSKNPADAQKAAASAGLGIVKDRDTVIRKVVWRKITCCEVLKEQDWPGKYIPIIPVLGEDVEVDGKRYLTGMVYNAMDAQRQYNYMSTAQTEAIALSPKAPFVGAVGQFEGYESVWQSANIQNHAFLPYNPISVDGTVLGAPQRIQAEPPVAAMVQATAKAAEDMKSTTGIYDASLGSRSNETSGKAILARQKEGDVSNFHYIDNLSRAIRHLGVILVDLIPKIYDAPRVIRIVNPDQTSETVHVNQPLDKSGKPVLSPEQQVAQAFDLSTGKYDVVVEVGPSFNTKRQEAADSIGTLIQAYPKLMDIAGDLLVKNMDWPQSQEIAERLKKTLPPQLQDGPDGEEPLPPQVKQSLDQSHQMVEALSQQVNKLMDERDAKTNELESKERIATQNNETQLAIATIGTEMQNNMKIFMAELQHRLDLLNFNQKVDDSTHAKQMAEQQMAAQPTPGGPEQTS